MFSRHEQAVTKRLRVNAAARPSRARSTVSQMAKWRTFKSLCWRSCWQNSAWWVSTRTRAIILRSELRYEPRWIYHVCRVQRVLRKRRQRLSCKVRFIWTIVTSQRFIFSTVWKRLSLWWNMQLTAASHRIAFLKHMVSPNPNSEPEKRLRIKLEFCSQWISSISCCRRWGLNNICVCLVSEAK